MFWFGDSANLELLRCVAELLFSEQRSIARRLQTAFEGDLGILPSSSLHLLLKIFFTLLFEALQVLELEELFLQAFQVIFSPSALVRFKEGLRSLRRKMQFERLKGALQKKES